METLIQENIAVNNPINGEKLYDLEETSDDTIKQLYQNAKTAQQKTATLTVEQRVDEVLKLRDYIIEHREIILDRIISETGKSRLDALTSELFEVCDFIHVFASRAPKILKDETVSTPIVLMGKKSKIFYEPLGTILIITPWNYPFYQGLIPAISAFLAGNSAIVKPSELTPLKSLFEEIFDKAGFPKNAIQIVYGSGVTGKRLIDAQPDKIHFTGSGKSGKKIMAQAAQNLIPVDLELGGKDPAIVFDDVKLERTVNGVLWGGLTTSGQACTSIERVYVQENIHDEFVNNLTEKAKKLRLATSTKTDDCDIGCLTADFQKNIINEHIQDALDKGAILHCGGIHTENNTFPPTILSNVDHSMKIMTEETFGPVIPVMKFKNEQEAIELANDSPYGLSASVWSKDMKRCERVARQLKTGNISINNHMLTEANPNLPFGGAKQSGFGRYKGAEGLKTFSNIKSVLIDKQSDIIEPHWYPYTSEKYQLLNQLILSFFSKSKNYVKFAITGLKLDSIGSKQKIK